MQRRAFLVMSALATVSACAVRVRAPVAEVVVARPPPPPRSEPPPPPPPGDPAVFVWQPGHWKWDGREYAWHPGHYARRPRRPATWVPAQWVERNGQWYYQPEHWDYH